ncbi:M28 family peptidase [Mycobacterium sp. CBMA293]|uniref:M28 family peptidase n=1 Tax=unclassified Mycolicibacterium TaxID=2636767 RepID=UPI0012DDDF06|nr:MULTISPECIES: M28 family peptidase [unclassified Mycolicibacterium]MUL44431.1 M28 family peptidase [Mycolicibacterium sp. CBMA 360]MUL59751.1 M28 family peptidase [Mycolicibacterium sp. CBMA 335]MUL68594.1 M28 family peptidase [Mycolicibacterium sp. CBMA 311]MUL94015.1 M28 family peptidase [Mycolicibacterium sp. CBMA 230]MUM06261.1 peptidase M28 [Mycolicibacterium sp. CBMA 213]
MRRALAAGLLAICVAACTPPAKAPVAQPAPEDPDLGHALAAKVVPDGMYAHLKKFAAIAAANKGTRADGTPGFQASVDYVANLLKDKGFDVETPEYVRVAPGAPGNPMLDVGGRQWSVVQASLLTPTAPGGLSGLTMHAVKPAGCAPADYGTLNLRGAIAVVDDTSCSVVDKQNVAVGRGAAAVLVVSTPGANGSPHGLFTPGYYEHLTTPVGMIGKDADTALLRTNAPVKLVLDAKNSAVKSRNVFAQTKTGDQHNVVMAGAHLDSTTGSAGINDAASGVSALLETAVALGGSPKIANAVRFTFWGSGAVGHEGATKYVRGLAADPLNDIALYLNFDILGSPNAGFFTLDGDQSGQPNPEIPVDAVPLGSASIERTLAGYLYLAGKRPADIMLDLGTDYGPFLTAGVPVGGISTGTTQRKTALQARLWGGQAGVAFDPTRGPSGDTVEALNRPALAATGQAVAFAVGAYAQSLVGPNGVPLRDQRHRQAGK